MLDVLARIEHALPELLRDESAWTGVYADTERPVLRRLWRQWGEHRIYLHRFEPCAPDEAFSHPHPWEFAVKVLSGTYGMTLGVSPDPAVVPPVSSTTRMMPGSVYDMTDPQWFHAIYPIGDDPVYSLMVGGPVIWPQNRIRANRKVRALTPEERADLFAFFRERYPP